MRVAVGLRAAAVAVMLSGVLLVSGCLRYTADLTLATDDTVSGSLVLAKKAPGGSAGDATGDGSNPTSAAYELVIPKPESTSRSITVDPYDYQGDVGYKVTFDHATFAEMGAFTPVTTRGGTLTLSRDEGRVKIDMSIDLTYADNSANEQLTKDFEGTIRMQVPGEVVQTNGQVDDEEIVWTLTPLEVNSLSAIVAYDNEEGAAVSAEGSTSGGFPLWGWVIAVVVVLGLAIAWLLSRRRKPRHEARHAAPRPDRQRGPQSAALTPAPSDSTLANDALPNGAAANDSSVLPAHAGPGSDRVPNADGWPPPRPQWRS